MILMMIIMMMIMTRTRHVMQRYQEPTLWDEEKITSTSRNRGA